MLSRVTNLQSQSEQGPLIRVKQMRNFERSKMFHRKFIGVLQMPNFYRKFVIHYA